MQTSKVTHTLSSFFDGTKTISIEPFKEHFTSLELKKNEYLVKEGTVCPYFCFVEEGILQHSVIIEEEEKTTYLALKNTITSSLKSFLFGEISRKNIKALTNTRLLIINLNDFKKLRDNNKEFHQFYYDLIEKQICLIDDYRIDLLTLTPEERYQKLLINEPRLLNEIPLHYLASFLGISDRHMSRIRKNIK
ncbi:Crp/Fnr family transcriptional regulator [Flavobacterium amniphilum]|uniref:Crp/Fnr family transcriptional regulator n=1 Tax=Flavobacterium amniphilum TaxID=1834035 RepID=UPI00202A27E2|nr:Crp/Fnr family transcriptional regulator [Flavobacterium amniphilum]MCL9806007.1 Crp/Fnr family transcriptional regulator [Flavobacterium amniphilum]